MITEIATLTIDPANAAPFEAAVREASAVLRRAGAHSMRLERVIEDPAVYKLIVQWDSVEHHMVTFRESEDFKQWRALAGPYFASPPSVIHTDEVGRFF